MDKEVLEGILAQADRFLQFGSSANDISTLIPDKVSPAHINPNVVYGDSSDGAAVLLPGMCTWPQGLYASVEINRFPGDKDKLEQVVRYWRKVSFLRQEASQAPTTFFGRLFKPTARLRAEQAAMKLDHLLNNVEVMNLAVSVEDIVYRVWEADKRQRREVTVIDGHAVATDAEHEAALQCVLTALEWRDVFVSVETLDPVLLENVRLQVSTYLHSIGNEHCLQERARQCVETLTNHRVETLLAQMPVEALKKTTGGRLRVAGLERMHIDNVQDVLETPVSVLTMADGVGEKTARRLIAAAESLRREAIAAAKPTIGTTCDPTTLNLVRILDQLRQTLPTDPTIRERRRRLMKMFDGATTTISPFDKVAVLVTGAGTAWNELQKDLHWAKNSPEELLPVTPIDKGAAAWDDYMSDPASYQVLLAEILHISDAGAETGAQPFDDNLVQKVRELELDTSLLTDLNLRGYQSFGARFALVQKKIVLGDEMGLGKTIEAITVAAHLAGKAAQAGEPFHGIVVCPASVIINWKREISRFVHLPVHVAHGDAKKTATAVWMQGGGLIILTYSGARTVADQILTAHADLIIVDEAHYIKNPRAKRSKAVGSLISSTPYALLLTGTPLENKVSDFTNLIKLVQPDLIIRGMGSLSADDFRTRVAPAYLRRNQTDVLDELPELAEQPDWVELTGTDLDIYGQAVKEGNWMLMRRAAWMSPTREPAKLTRLKEIVADAKESGSRVLVFSYFLDVIDVVTAGLGDVVLGIIDGKVSPVERQQLVDRLGRSAPGSVLAAQITAGGTGLNIQAANVVVLCEPQVKPTLEAQAIARTHRLGQQRTVHVHRLIGDDTVDERMMEMLSGKESIFDAYARTSVTALENPASIDVSEPQMAREIIEAEQQRLGFVE